MIVLGVLVLFNIMISVYSPYFPNTFEKRRRSQISRTCIEILWGPLRTGAEALGFFGGMRGVGSRTVCFSLGERDDPWVPQSKRLRNTSDAITGS